MATQPSSPSPHLIVRQYATILIDRTRVPCAITDRMYVYIPVLGVCEVIGIDAEKEEQRIQNDPALSEGLAYLPFSLRIEGHEFQSFEIACINLTRLHTWLWGIQLKDVSEGEMRSKLLVFKRELADLAYAYYGRPMLSQDIKAEEQQYLTEEQQSRFAILDEQYHTDHPTVVEEHPDQEPEQGLTVVVSSEAPQVEFIDNDQGRVYRDMIGILGKLAQRKKIPGDKRKGFERVEAGLKETFGFTYYWAIPAYQWEAIVRHCIQVYQGYAGRDAPLPPIFTNALKMKAKPKQKPTQSRLF